MRALAYTQAHCSITLHGSLQLSLLALFFLNAQSHDLTKPVCLLQFKTTHEIEPGVPQNFGTLISDSQAANTSLKIQVALNDTLTGLDHAAPIPSYHAPLASDLLPSWALSDVLPSEVHEEHRPFSAIPPLILFLVLSLTVWYLTKDKPRRVDATPTGGTTDSWTGLRLLLSTSVFLEHLGYHELSISCFFFYGRRRSHVFNEITSRIWL
jgi:hypothetical protein